MKKQFTRKEAEKKIVEFFKSEHNAEEVRKIKRLAMAYNIKLRELRKNFCRKCYSMNLRVKSVKKGMKRVECPDCNNIMRWKIKG